MRNLDVKISKIELTEKNTLRVPPRKEEDQQPNYKELFDYHTLFSDAFFSEENIELVGPPLLNLHNILLSGEIYIDEKNVTKEAIIQSEHRKCRVLLPKIPGAKKVIIKFEDVLFEQEIQPDESDFFANHNVLVTQQKDNPLEWIGYWIAHHIKHHKINAVLIYDNDSSLYDINQLKTFLSSIKGLEKICVVPWSIPYGVTGGDKQIWDSDFGQYQSWEHALKRFVYSANCVVIGDVDELVIHKDGLSLPDILDSIDEPVITYKRRQIIEVASTEFTNLPRMHNHTHLYEKERILYAPKYAFKPKKLSKKVHLLVHKVEGDKSKFSEELLGRHFGILRLHWRVGNFEPIELRDRSSYKTPLSEDMELFQSFNEVDLSWLKG
ncbi:MULTISPECIES: hypothetical protein [Actinobacillus]|uniref:Capsular polysaccharide synthesis protein C n=1 Tax=Actinobacillus pleuropneumoniae TaxID=715 RepID=A0A0F7R6W2_ACTPL|nr:MULTISPECIES: hypothetical protein [Actinobacillus]AVY03735.1 capsular polysaccharide biosynthesis protein Cps15C [Actinobacillus pleuropneumoniae]UKH23260.1 hypothetical protein D1108_08170 [Actinobacillus pleuropneumoniae]USQ16220.1 hypothetical protein J3K87_08585 [Actinobacillus pleuropneumoniae]WGE81187.1 hypothetical protein NYR66_09715 [Actinobacillus equuli subsp. haemolyticus]BAR72994.1 capsular polysaccharide synthesis protein C [Actinobacillus pleuropneumoniae]